MCYYDCKGPQKDVSAAILAAPGWIEIHMCPDANGYGGSKFLQGENGSLCRTQSNEALAQVTMNHQVRTVCASGSELTRPVAPALVLALGHVHDRPSMRLPSSKLQSRISLSSV